MRPIDADALRDRLQILAYDDWNQGITSSFADACQEIIDIIEEQTTIELPERKGRWEVVNHRAVEHGEVVIDGDTARCSLCRHAEKGWNIGMKYCPNCGRRMVGESN